MNRLYILPAAFAAALLVAGGASKAFAEDQFDHSHNYIPSYNSSANVQPTKKMATSMQSTWKGSSNKISLSQAEDLAIKRVGGTVVATDHFGPGFGMYKIDLKNGNQMNRVYVNARTGALTVASSLDPAFDPSIVGGDHLFKKDGEAG